MSTVTTHSPFLNIFRRYLRERGLPITGQRESVADVMFTSTEHLSIEDIEAHLRQRGERIGKATIYRTMEILVRSGLVEEHDFGEGFKRYEHLFGVQPIHEHLICTHCGRVTEFQSAEVIRIRDEAAAAHGFRPARHRLEVYGLCSECDAAGVELDSDTLTCPVFFDA